MYGSQWLLALLATSSVKEHYRMPAGGNIADGDRGGNGGSNGHGSFAAIWSGGYVQVGHLCALLWLKIIAPLTMRM